MGLLSKLLTYTDHMHSVGLAVIESLPAPYNQVPLYILYTGNPPRSTYGTNTGDALRQLRTEVFADGKGARRADVAIPRVAVVMTDGESNVNATQTIPSALALQDAGVDVYVVGVGSQINLTEVEGIASSSKNVRLLLKFDNTEFQDVRSRLIPELCTGEYIDSLSDYRTNVQYNYYNHL